MFVYGLLLCLSCVFLRVTSECPKLANTNGIMTANISWTFDMWVKTCSAKVAGSSSFTYFQKGETKAIAGLNNDCIKFTCDQDARVLLLGDSSCAFGSGCSKAKKKGGSCDETYKCYTDVYDSAPSFTYTDYYHFKHGWFAFFSGYTCGNTGKGHCSSEQCFNRFADPKKDNSEVKHCLDKEDNVVNEQNQQYVCTEKTTCDSNTYVDLTASGAGCDNDGEFVAAGTVTQSDACSQTVCVIDDEGTDKFVTSFKDKEGCVNGDECVAVGETVSGVSGHVCADMTCTKDTERADPFYFELSHTGCHLDGKCYKQGKKARTGDKCEKLECKTDNSNTTYFWERKFTGCYKPSGERCSHRNNRSYKAGKCVEVKCFARGYGQWRTQYLDSCVPSDGGCDCTDGSPGCEYKGKCYPVKSVMKMDSCTQYVCHSDDPSLNNGTFTTDTPKPTWKARATGCYGPTGCMKLGEQYVDPNTFNTYRCDYNLAGWGAKIATFHQACVAPNGDKLKLGDSVKVGSTWHSCYRWGRIRNPIDTSEVFVPEDHNQTCGINPDTGEVLWKAQFYYTPVGRCIKRGYNCEETCQYFDQPCMDTDVTPWRFIGDKFDLDGSQCVCTQDTDVNNENSHGRFYQPSLCSQKGVTNGACKDPVANKGRKWGEFWKKSGSNPTEICTCHPLTREPFCSSFLPDVNAVFDDMSI